VIVAVVFFLFLWCGAGLCSVFVVHATPADRNEASPLLDLDPMIRVFTWIWGCIGLMLLGPFALWAMLDRREEWIRHRIEERKNKP
jgi:hypothetical protein